MILTRDYEIRFEKISECFLTSKSSHLILDFWSLTPDLLKQLRTVKSTQNLSKKKSEIFILLCVLDYFNYHVCCMQSPTGRAFGQKRVNTLSPTRL